MMTPTTDPWFEVVGAAESLTQGDLILDCPLLGWRADGRPGTLALGQSVELRHLADGYLRDVVVMTQACDLEHRKVYQVVLCPTCPLSAFRMAWEAERTARGQNPTEKAWRAICDDIKDGYVWNRTFLNGFEEPAIGTEVRVVSFHEVFTLPRWFLEAVLSSRGQPRLRLRPPYREHLSRAFARFFMRVGLPQPVDKVW